MTDPPTGTVTLLFTDSEGSTRVRGRSRGGRRFAGDEAGARKLMLDAVVR